MGGTPEVGKHAATAAHTSAAPAPKITRTARQDAPAATAEEEKERVQSLLGALRDPN